jgi:hypothetical protein
MRCGMSCGDDTEVETLFEEWVREQIKPRK